MTVKLVSCEYGQRDGDCYEHCCLRERYGEDGAAARAWHRCAIYDHELCPFGRDSGWCHVHTNEAKEDGE